MPPVYYHDGRFSPATLDWPAFISPLIPSWCNKAATFAARFGGFGEPQRDLSLFHELQTRLLLIHEQQKDLRVMSEQQNRRPGCLQRNAVLQNATAFHG